ncbi:DNA polymerase III subunit delta [Candidatus Hepatincolaceae symbiont of Richtersius coronifer]
MKIPPHKISDFISKPPAQIKIILFYGPNQGLISQSVANIKGYYLNQYPQAEIINLFEEDLKASYNRLQEEADNLSLFGHNYKIIIIKEGSEVLSKLLKDYLTYNDETSVIIIQGEDLGPSSTLRKLAEQSDSCAALPCYQDTTIILRQVILAKIKQEKFTIEPDALNLLMIYLGNDRLITINEIDKLILYKYTEKYIALKDIEDIIGDNSLTIIDKVIFNIFIFNLEIYMGYLENLLEQFNPIMVIRSLSNHTQKMQFVKLAIQQQNVDIVLREIKPPIFFLYLDLFKQSLNIWSIESLNLLANDLMYLEIEAKLSPNIASLLVKNFVLNIIKYQT